MWRQRPPPQRPPPSRAKRATTNATVWGDQPPLSGPKSRHPAKPVGSGSELSQAFSDGSRSSHCCCCPGVLQATRRPQDQLRPPTATPSTAARDVAPTGRLVRSGSPCRQGSTRAKAAGLQQVQGDGPGFMVQQPLQLHAQLLASAGGAVPAHPHLPGPGPCCNSFTDLLQSFKAKIHAQTGAVACCADHSGGVIADAAGMQKLQTPCGQIALTPWGSINSPEIRSRAMAFMR